MSSLGLCHIIVYCSSYARPSGLLIVIIRPRDYLIVMKINFSWFLTIDSSMPLESSTPGGATTVHSKGRVHRTRPQRRHSLEYTMTRDLKRDRDLGFSGGLNHSYHHSRGQKNLSQDSHLQTKQENQAKSKTSRSRERGV
jgi:hypothetical protein